MKKITKRLSNIFFLDTKALAIMRIAMALIILVDIATQIPFLTELFTSNGIVPPDVIASEFSLQNLRTIHTLSGELWYLVVLLIIHIGVTISRWLGWKTKTMWFFVWFMTYSFHNVNPLYQYGFDELIHITLFRTMFLPMGKVWALDAIKEFWSIEGKAYQFGSIASIWLILHLIGLYTVAMWLRAEGIIQAENHTRLYNILHHTYMVRPIGEAIRSSLTLSQILLWVTIIVESCMRLFWLIPTRRDISRKISVSIFILRHLGLRVAMDVGLFPLASIVILLGLYSFNSIRVWREKKNLSLSWLLGWIICYTILWNISLVSDQRRETKILPDNMYKFAYVFGMHHNRGLFQWSGKDYLWYIITGQKENGEEIDMLHGNTITDYTYLEYPDHRYYATHRHIKVLQSIPYYLWVMNFISYHYCHQYPEVTTIKIQEMLRQIPHWHTQPAQRKLINHYDCVNLVEISNQN